MNEPPNLRAPEEARKLAEEAKEILGYLKTTDELQSRIDEDDEARHLIAFTVPALASALLEAHGEIERLCEERDKEFEIASGYHRQVVRLKEEVARVEELEGALRAYKEAIGYVRGCYPEDVFLPDSDSLDASSARWARVVCDNIKVEAERRAALSPEKPAKKEEGGD